MSKPTLKEYGQYVDRGTHIIIIGIKKIVKFIFDTLLLIGMTLTLPVHGPLALLGFFIKEKNNED